MSRVTEQYEQACKYLAGGVSASTRLNRALGQPMLVDRADGCRIWDLDGREYIDLCCSHGATLLGHGDPRVRHAVERVLARGARLLLRERTAHAAGAIAVRDDAVLRARAFHRLRHARRPCTACGWPGRTPAARKLLKFEGNFHGYHDQVMYAIGTPADRLGPEDAPTALSRLDRSARRARCKMSSSCRTTAPTCWKPLSRATAAELAAVICEPIYYNAGCIMPTPEFLNALRRLTREHGVLLIFDEVLSAFRMAPGGAQEYLGVTPDLCTLGKAVGGGFPLSVFGGRRDIMDRLMPHGRLPAQRHLQRPSRRRRRRPGRGDSLSSSPASTTTSTPSPSGCIAG